VAPLEVRVRVERGEAAEAAEAQREYFRAWLGSRPLFGLRLPRQIIWEAAAEPLDDLVQAPPEASGWMTGFQAVLSSCQRAVALHWANWTRRALWVLGAEERQTSAKASLGRAVAELARRRVPRADSVGSPAPEEGPVKAAKGWR
jgi:hypothetical protein